MVGELGELSSEAIDYKGSASVVHSPRQVDANAETKHIFLISEMGVVRLHREVQIVSVQATMRAK